MSPHHTHMSFHNMYEQITELLENNAWDFNKFILQVLQQNPSSRPSIDLSDILNTLLKPGHSVQKWVMGEAESIYASDLQHLLKPQHGLRIHAQNFTIADIDHIMCNGLASIYSEQAPLLWRLDHVLLDVDRGMQHCSCSPSSQSAAPLTNDDVSEEDSDKDLVMGELPKLSSAAAQNAVLLKVVSFWPPMNWICLAGALQKATQVISIFMQSSNTHYNILQAILSLFLAAINAPEALREVLAHAGLGVSLPSLKTLLDAIGDNALRLLKLAYFGHYSMALFMKTFSVHTNYGNQAPWTTRDWLVQKWKC